MTATNPADRSARIRTARVEDADALVEFNREMALETERRSLPAATVAAGVRAVLADPGHGFYAVAEDAGAVVGGLMVTYEWSDWRNARFWWIQSVYVRPEHRGRGIYRALHEFVRERARAARGVCGLRLYVERGNAPAQEVYAAIGMEDSGYLVLEEML